MNTTEWDREATSRMALSCGTRWYVLTGEGSPNKTQWLTFHRDKY